MCRLCELIGQRLYTYLNCNHLYKNQLNKLTYRLHISKKHDFPEDGQELRPKPVGAIINKNIA